jgi:IS605 OrfB family transposase
MELTLKIQLVPDAAQDQALRATLGRFNEAANWVAGQLFTHQITNKRQAQKLVYRPVRDLFGLSAQMAILVIHRVCEAFKRDPAIRPTFRDDAAITYDPRVMRFLGLDHVNLWTLDGRLVLPMVIGTYQAQRIGYPKGQCDLVLRKDGRWFLMVTVKAPEDSPIEPKDFLGVDLGIVNLATDSNGQTHSGAEVETVRKKHNLQRKRLQRKGTKGAHKKLKRMRHKEARFRRHQNHVISKEIVQTAKRTECGIALEQLKGIRKRVTARGGDAKNRLGGWAFAQLGGFILYKARLAGVPVEFVNPAYSSQTCAACGHRRRSNRKSQAEFQCQACGHEAHADANAARNHRAQALSKRALGLGVRARLG